MDKGELIKMRRLAIALLGTALVCATAAVAADGPALVLKDHKFQPQSIEVPAGKRVKLTITNSDDSRGGIRQQRSACRENGAARTVRFGLRRSA